jgi:hypothetical protein
MSSFVSDLADGRLHKPFAKIDGRSQSIQLARLCTPVLFGYGLRR